MHIIRPIEAKDTETFIAFAHEASLGITSMPKNRQALIQRVEHAVSSYSKNVTHPTDESYLFVLEDLETGSIGGTCGIMAKTARINPLSFFRSMRNEVHRGIDGTQKTVPMLSVVHYTNYWSEICSLYLCDQYRHGGLGRLLSLSRFHFIASHPERFEKMLFAEMRGYIDTHNHCPFWEGIGRHFFNIEFEELMHLRDEGKIDLRDILPAYPIYIELLPAAVQEAIGKLHDETVPANKMLQEEGFYSTDEIDICDGGPKLAVETKNIRTIRESFIANVEKIVPALADATPFLVSTVGSSFKAIMTPATIQEGKIQLPVNSAEALGLDIGSPVRYSPAYQHQRGNP